MFGAQCPDCAVCGCVAPLSRCWCPEPVLLRIAAAAQQQLGLAVQYSVHTLHWRHRHTQSDSEFTARSRSSDVTGAVPVTLSRSVTCHAVRDWCLQVGRGQWVGSSRRWNLGYAEHQGCERVRVPSNSQQTTDTGAEIMWRRGWWW